MRVLSCSLILFDRSLCSFSASFLNSLGMCVDMSFQACVTAESVSVQIADKFEE